MTKRIYRYKPKPQSEKEFQAMVIRAAKLYGWRVYHTFDSRRSAPGFPDLILIRGPVLLAIELKSEKGKPTKEQLEWLAAFAGVEEIFAELIRPDDFGIILNKLHCTNVSPSNPTIKSDG